ncbi:MAG: efflux RND transporter permease subunit, partial [Gemmatimonadota bacterium]
MKQLFSELKRRKVYHVAVTYAVVAFVTLQAAELIFPATTLEGIYDVLVVIAFVGFPLALVLAWAFEMTPDGVRRTSTGGEAGTAGAPEDASFSTEERRSRSRRAMSALVALGLVGAAVAGGWWYLTGGGSEQSEEARLGDRSIAVLPFEALGQEVRGPFTEGMHDDLLARLSNVSDFKVISRTTVQRYRDTDLTTAEIAAELGVRWVLEGGVQEMGEEIQVNAQLIDPRSDTHAWAESYRRDLTAESLFDLQSEITQQIAQALEYPQFDVEVDRTRAMYLGVDQEEVAQTVLTALGSSVGFPPTIWIDPESDTDFFMGVQYKSNEFESLDEVRNIPISLNTEDGPVTIPLSNIATVKRVTIPGEIAHYNITRVNDVHVNVAGRDVGSV